ncbi:glycosyltransferase family 29 protein [Alloalcanivorax gelatiniphagus]|uniref:glycosyltransferase family 29 protein n=1 Tax=Alloalcanivorax gelatiniphagus TaxID=1194167 RepID=UPI001476DEE1|nr:glycosyltransferase family 29 protein [Alloalcanivorax gelatiniphagus]
MKNKSYITWLIKRSYWRFRLELISGRDDLPRSLFKNKRIIIIGPASEVELDAKGKDIDDYDIIIRMNAGVKHATELSGALGNRTDFLFHNFKMEGERAAGVLNNKILNEHKVKKIIYPTLTAATLKDYLQKRESLKRTIQEVEVAFLPPSSYRRICRKFTPYSPTIGSIIIDFVLSTDFKELCIIGMSLFRTGYDQHYNNKAPDVSSTRKWTEAGGVHNPDFDFAITSRALREAIDDERNIVLGRGLSEALGVPFKGISTVEMSRHDESSSF